MNCPRCNKDNPDGSQFCNGCGSAIVQPKKAASSFADIWNGMSPKAKLWAGIGCIVFLIWIINSASGTRSSRDTKTSNSQSTPPVQQKAEPSKPTDPEPSIPASVHLANAKKALADGYVPSGKNKAWGRVKDAKESLQQIKFTDKGYPEARKLIQVVERREAEIAEWASTTARQLFAEQAEKNYLEKGMDVTVSVRGPNNTIIKLKYILISRPMVYQMTNDTELMATLRNAGFKKVVFTDGYRSTWTQDVD